MYTPPSQRDDRPEKVDSSGYGNNTGGGGGGGGSGGLTSATLVTAVLNWYARKNGYNSIGQMALGGGSDSAAYTQGADGNWYEVGGDGTAYNYDANGSWTEVGQAPDGMDTSSTTQTSTTQTGSTQGGSAYTEGTYADSGGTTYGNNPANPSSDTSGQTWNSGGGGGSFSSTSTAGSTAGGANVAGGNTWSAGNAAYGGSGASNAVGGNLGILGAFVYVAMWSMARNKEKQARAEGRYLDALRAGAEADRIGDGLVYWTGYSGAGGPEQDAYLAGMASPEMNPGSAGWYSQYLLDQAGSDYGAQVQHTGNLGGDVEAGDSGAKRTNVTEFRDIDEGKEDALAQRIEQDYAPVVQWANEAPVFRENVDGYGERDYWLSNNPPPNVQNWQTAYDTHSRQNVLVRSDFQFEGQSRYRRVNDDNLVMWAPPSPLPDDQRWGQGASEGMMSFDQFERDRLYGYNLTPSQKWAEYNAYKASVNPNYTVGGKTPESQYLTPENQTATAYRNAYNPASDQSRNEWSQAQGADQANSAGVMHDGSDTGRYWETDSTTSNNPGASLASSGSNTTNTSTLSGGANQFIHHTNPNAMSAFGSAIVLNPGVNATAVTWGGQNLVLHGSLDKGRQVWHVPNRQRGQSGAITVTTGGQTYGQGPNANTPPYAGNTNSTTHNYPTPPTTNDKGQNVLGYKAWEGLNADNKSMGASGYQQYQTNMGLDHTPIGRVATKDAWLAQAGDYWNDGSAAHQTKGYNQYLTNMGVSVN